MFHLCKPAASREARALFAGGGAVLEDHVYGSPEVAKTQGALLPELLPLLFLFMDSDVMFERAMELIHTKTECVFSAIDFTATASEGLAARVIETCLCTTAGESILRVVYDKEGNLVPTADLEEVDQYRHCKVSAHLQPSKYVTSGADKPAHWREAAQFEMLLGSRAAADTCISFVAEGESHHLYEIRIHKLHQRGEVATAARLEAIPIDETLDDSDFGQDGGADRPEPTKANERTAATTGKKVKFQDTPSDNQGPERAERDGTLAQAELYFYFEKFQALNFYYQQVNRLLGGGVAPSFYRFRLCPVSGPLLNRAFEVEEHLGRGFLEEAAQMHLDHQRAQAHFSASKNLSWQAEAPASQNQKSLPAFIIGRLVALLCKKLERVRCEDQSVLEGAGALVYCRKTDRVRGSVRRPKEYYEADCHRFQQMRDRLRGKWLLYISALEAEIIEEKLDTVLSSLTFKYSRQPELLSLIPDQVTEANLRVASVVKLHREQTVKTQKKTATVKEALENADDAAFYRDVYGDPDRA